MPARADFLRHLPLRFRIMRSRRPSFPSIRQLSGSRFFDPSPTRKGEIENPARNLKPAACRRSKKASCRNLSGPSFPDEKQSTGPFGTHSRLESRCVQMIHLEVIPARARKVSASVCGKCRNKGNSAIKLPEGEFSPEWRQPSPFGNAEPPTILRSFPGAWYS